MVKKLIILAVFVMMATLGTHAWAVEKLEYFKVYKPKLGMSADEIMNIWYHIKYTLFSHDYEQEGKVFFIEKSGAKRERGSLRQRITLGRGSDDMAYKDLVMFTYPTSVQGLGILTWTYMEYGRDQDQWLWLPSLRKIRKVSAANADDAFLGSDFTVEEITTRRFEDETYKLLGEENFKGFTSEYTGQTFYAGIPCWKIEATPKREHWYYSKRTVWISKEHGGNIYEEIYDPLGRFYKTLFRGYKIYNVNGREYPTQDYLECKDLRTGHKTVIENGDVKFDSGLSEDVFTQKTLSRQGW